MKNASITYLIQTLGYDKNVGGICALHYLADRLKALGEEVYLTTDELNPSWQGAGIDLDTPFFLTQDQLSRLYRKISKLKHYIFFNTFKRKLTRLQRRIFPKLLWRHFEPENTIVIYPEVTIGNPLQATHVVRWIMNTPVVCGGDGEYQPTDHIFQYHDWFAVDKRYTVRGELRAIDLNHQLATYRNTHNPQRKGGAYLVRKGLNKPLDQHPQDFVHADPILQNATHEEAATFFNSIQTLVSYDDMTFISVQAALCGCESIIIAGQGVRSEETLKKINRINGVAYGWGDLDWAKGSLAELRPSFEAMNAQNLATIAAFNAYCHRALDS